MEAWIEDKIGQFIMLGIDIYLRGLDLNRLQKPRMSTHHIKQ